MADKAKGSRATGETSARDWLKTKDAEQAKKLLKDFGKHCQKEGKR